MSSVLWRVDGEGGRWVQQDHAGQITADDVTGQIGQEANAKGLGVLVTPTGPIHAPAAADDPTWWFLYALQVMPQPTATGTFPAVPAAPWADTVVH